MGFETVIGLEVHTELSTRTKIFCGCSTDFGGAPNSHTCPVCLGMPGSLPVLNKAVVEKAIRAGLALNCTIQTDNLFDRKNYFYPDLPKDYQISQLYHPICRNGYVDVDMGQYTRRVRIHEIHMEEDAGKLIHDVGVSLVDYNRCGVPLIEIVTEPDMRSAEEVGAFLERLREILVYLDVSDCKMEEGSMRADVNLSLRETGDEAFGTRTETKNMNSVKAIKRAISFEVARQAALLEAGQKVDQETRRWDDTTGTGSAMRGKENAQDYRYFPDPDLVPLHVDETWVSQVRESLPEQAAAKRDRYQAEWGISKMTATVLTAERDAALLFERVTDALGGGRDGAREAANIVAGDIMRLSSDFAKIDAEAIATILRMIIEGRVNRNVGREIACAVIRDNADPEEYVKTHGLEMIGDKHLIEEIVARILAENADSVADYRAGKTKAFGHLVGQAMKALKGKADPQAVNAILRASLDEGRVKEGLDGASGRDPKTGDRVDEGREARSEKSGKNKSEKFVDERREAQSEKSGKSESDKSVGEEREAQKETPEKNGSEEAGELEAREARGWTPPVPAWKKAMAATQGLSSGNLTDTQAPDGPFSVSDRYRTHTCGALLETDIGSNVRLAGWIHTIRNHGGIVFIDLRDQYGVTQVVVSDEQVRGLHKEMTISVFGKVLLRDPETVNPAIETGKVELKAANIELLGDCKNILPFEIETSKETKEELRLKHRYLVLRNPAVHDKIVLRAEVRRYLRREMESLGFLEIQTPILANSSPEGARDYLVPSRKHKGRFYALPQAPQQFKQLLMVSGFDRYFQIAPCFRDEDARLDRSPGEFYQLDYEMAFATQEDVFAVAERVMTKVFDAFSDKETTAAPFPRIPYKDAMLKYGSDKPDLRNPLEIIDLTDFFAEVEFKPFRGNIVRGIAVPGAARQPRSFFSSMEKYALSIGMKGLGYISVQSDMAYKGPIDKFFTDAQKQSIAKIAGLKPGDVLYFISDAPKAVAGLAGQIRSELGKRLDLIKKDRYDFCFITDYPMYEENEETGQIDFTHNPFSMPQGEMEALERKDPLEILAWQYDIVCNGVELSSGAVRNHRPDIMVKAFEIAGYSERDVAEKFGALFNAFQYGAPPHAGMAPGVDRIVMLLSGDENIREVIAFPLDSNARNLMLDAPSEVTEQQLREIHIKVR
jgi:aspartyl-tRNA synthetase